MGVYACVYIIHVYICIYTHTHLYIFFLYLIMTRTHSYTNNCNGYIIQMTNIQNTKKNSFPSYVSNYSCYSIKTLRKKWGLDSMTIRTN